MSVCKWQTWKVLLEWNQGNNNNKKESTEDQRWKYNLP